MTEATHELGAATVATSRTRHGAEGRPASSLPVRTAHPTLLTQAVPWCLLGLLVVGGLGWAGAPAWDIARYTAYWSLAVVLPGMLVFRAVGWRVPGVAEDVAYGSATGLALELVALAGSVALGLQDWLKLWPGLVIALFVAVPSLRRHWWRRSDRPLPAVWSWLMSGVLALVVGPVIVQMAGSKLPPATFRYYQDLLYHLSISEELTRAVPPQVPQLSGETLHYHWFSHAHMAASHLVTGVPLPTVLLKLWIVPIIIVGTLATAALTRQCARRWWAGLIAAAIASLSPAIYLSPDLGLTGIGWIYYLSPSLTYSVAFLMPILSGLVVLLRGGRLGRSWVLLILLLVAVSGAKSSALPAVLAGVVLAGVAASVVDRRRLRPAIIAIALVLAVLVGAAGVMSGAARAGGRLAPFAFLERMSSYRALVGSPHINGRSSGWLPDGINQADGDARVAVAAILLYFVLTHAVLSAGLVLLMLRRTRRDLAVWLVAGTYLGGLAALLVISHPGAAEIYFAKNVTPVGGVLAGWLVAAFLSASRVSAISGQPRAVQRPAAAMLVIAFTLGAALALTVAAFAPAPPGGKADLRGWLHAMFDPVVIVAAVLALGLACWAGLRRGFPALKGLGAAVLVATVLGLCVPSAAIPARRILHQHNARATASTSPYAVTSAEVQAAQWVGRHAEPDDVLATNVHCQPVLTRPTCDARAFWVTGFAGRRAVIEGWGFSAESVAAHGKRRLGYARQPAPFPERLALNDGVFAAPTAENLGELRRRYGVRWLVADGRAGFVSSDLDKLAVKRYERGSVTVYELP